MFKLITPDGRTMEHWPQVGEGTFPTVEEALQAALDMAVEGAPAGQVCRGQLYAGVYWPASGGFSELWVQVVPAIMGASS